MRVAFDESANVYFNDDLTLQEREELWIYPYSFSRMNTVHEKSRIVNINEKGMGMIRTGDSIPLALIIDLAVRNLPRHDKRIQKLLERRRRVRMFVRCIIDEHNSLKEIGITNSSSLFRMSAVCSKTDVVMAQHRAACHAMMIHGESSPCGAL